MARRSAAFVLAGDGVVIRAVICTWSKCQVLITNGRIVPNPSYPGVNSFFANTGPALSCRVGNCAAWIRYWSGRAKLHSDIGELVGNMEKLNA